MLTKTLRTHLANLWSQDRELQNKAFLFVLKVTDKPVDWAYETWDSLLENLTHSDNHNRAIAAQVGALEMKSWGRREFHMIVPSGVCFQFYQRNG